MPKKVKYWVAAQVECEAMSNWIQKEKTDASEHHGSGTAYLAILERRGVLDGVLAILLAAQAWAMWRFPASNPATPLGWVAGTSLVIWFVVVLGAIAPRAVFINAPINDANFEVSGVRRCYDAVRPVYARIFNEPDKLVAHYPVAEHDFPDETRFKAYAFLDKLLKGH